MPVDSKRLLSAVMDGIDPGCDSSHSQGYYNILNVRLDSYIQQENINYVKRAFFNCVDMKFCLARVCCPGVANRTHSRSFDALYIPAPVCAHNGQFFERLIHETLERRKLGGATNLVGKAVWCDMMSCP